MHLMAQEEYGLRCLLQVAKAKSKEPLTISDIAESEGLSLEYAAKLLRQLRLGGLLESRRGASGGYWLSRPATEISAWEALEVLGGAFVSEDFCRTHPGQSEHCVRDTDCGIRPLWEVIENKLRDVLSQISLADLGADERTIRQRLGVDELPIHS